jgi:hypothetical protein
MTVLTRKGQKIFMPTVQIPHPGQPQMQVPAVQIPVNHVPDIGTEKPILILIAIVPAHFQFFKMGFHSLKVMCLVKGHISRQIFQISMTRPLGH